MRFPFDPLVPHIEARWTGDNAGGRVAQIGITGKAASVLGVNRIIVGRWVSEGLPHSAADRCACALGYHPVMLWPDWLEEVDPDAPFDLDAMLKPNRHPPREAQPCGTMAAARRHERNREPLCFLCGLARQRYRRERKSPERLERERQLDRTRPRRGRRVA